MLTTRLARGFSLINLLVVVVVIVVLFVGAALLLAALGRARSNARQLYDGGQIRGIHQGMVLWAENNGGLYPLPSRIDLNDETVADQGRTKDTTANIFSILIYNNFFSPEICVGMGEASPKVRVHDTYAFREPPTAVNPKKALWDPAFSADFRGGKTGNFSYGHMLPADGRLEKTWKNTYNDEQAVIGNRGPQIMGFGVSNGKRLYLAAGGSNTFLIHGGRTTWEGNIAYNDNHVNFETSLAPEGSTYTDAAGEEQPDCLFSDENTDASGINNFLGIFITAGPTKADYRAIWD